MKKAKVLLSTLCMVAAIATSFAFKASKFSSHFVYTGALGSGVCQTLVNGRAILCSGTPQVAVSTQSLASGCPNAATTIVAD